MINNEFLQSEAWGDFQKSLGTEVYRININDAMTALILKKELPFGFNYLYIPRGPFLNNVKKQEILIDFCNRIKKVAVDKKTIFLKIEPPNIKKDYANFLGEMGFIKSESIQPKNTLIIDLKKSEEEILKEMEHDTRYAIRVSQRRGVVVENSFGTDEQKRAALFKEFYHLFSKTAARQKLKSYPKKYFENLLNLNEECGAEIFIARLDKQAISTALILFYNNQAFYLYAGSESGYGKYNAPSLVLWTAISQARKRGFEIFDLWGIGDENQKKWRGFTDFKKSFGGVEFKYPGAWDFVYNRGIYIAYNLLKSARKLFINAINATI